MSFQEEPRVEEYREPVSANVQFEEIQEEFAPRSQMEAALYYARHGIAVFPCNPLHKAPLVGRDKDADGNPIDKTGGLYKATTNIDQVRAWWTMWPNAMIGIRMGEASGIWAIDPDAPKGPGDPDGRKNWEELQQQHGVASRTHTHDTPGGGQHLLFKYCPDKPVTTTEGALKGLGINVRGNGGYIIAPPSTNGEGKDYAIADPEEFFNFAEAPDWLYDLILTEREAPEQDAPQAEPYKPSAGSRESRRRYAEAALRGECNFLSRLAKGSKRRNTELNRSAFKLGTLVASGDLSEGEVRTALYSASVFNGLTKDPNCGPQGVRDTISSGLGSGMQHPRDIPNRDHNPRGGEEAEPEEIVINELPPMKLAEWRNRELPPPDFLMGHWMTSTTRCLLTADTGLGKTNLCLAIGVRIAAGVGFLHWQPRRPCRVLYIDGEMSRSLLQKRLRDETERLGIEPEGFMALSREDVTDMKPFNDPRGQTWVDVLIEKIGGVDLIIFDNIMCLTVGNPKDPEPWQLTLPWALTLTHRRIGQIWIHHTGHDPSRSYGDKSREWQMDTTIHLDAVKRADTDVSFKMAFKKARERTPDTRIDFQDVVIAIVNDQWEHLITEGIQAGKISPLNKKALDALTNVVGSDKVVVLTGNRRAAKADDWKAECMLLGLIDPKAKGHSARTLFAKFKRELYAANRIANEGDFSWLLH
jgi:hypothetical protein